MEEILNELALVSALSKNLEIRLRRGHDSKMCAAAFKEISQHAQKARELYANSTDEVGNRIPLR